MGNFGGIAARIALILARNGAPSTAGVPVLPSQVKPKQTPMASEQLATLRPCRSPYCECDSGKCTHPGCYDARGTT